MEAWQKTVFCSHALNTKELPEILKDPGNPTAVLQGRQTALQERILVIKCTALGLGRNSGVGQLFSMHEILDLIPGTMQWLVG